jgi:hypothetical protein
LSGLREDGGEGLLRGHPRGVGGDFEGLRVAYESTGCADPDFGDWYELDGETAPHAICLAALEAVK